MTKKQDRAWNDYSEHFRHEVLGKLMDSAVFLSIGSDVGKFDVQQATELGAALLMDKPILLVCPRGRKLPVRLRRAADFVVDNWDPDDPDAQERMVAAMRQMGLEKD
jgi:hypothetical protein